MRSGGQKRVALAWISPLFIKLAALSGGARGVGWGRGAGAPLAPPLDPPLATAAPRAVPSLPMRGSFHSLIWNRKFLEQFYCCSVSKKNQHKLNYLIFFNLLACST